MADTIGTVILAAGKGTRMKTDTPKALALAAGKPLLDYVIQSVKSFSEKENLTLDIGVVVGHQKELLIDWLDSLTFKVKTAWQKEQLGTADALKSCFHDLPEFWNYTYTMIACADTPLISASEFHRLFQELKSDSVLMGVAATFSTSQPTGYGRIVRSSKGFHIVEEKDATDDERKISEVNSGFYIVRTDHLKQVLNQISNKNKSGEFYLTDLFQDQYAVKAVPFSNETPFLGINTLEQLSHVSDILRSQKLKQLMESGVTILDPRTCYIDHAVSVGVGSILYPFTTILGKTQIGEKVMIESGCFIKNSRIENGAHLLANSYLEEALVRSEASVGPMAHLRPGSDLGEKVKVGNFVEIKKSILKAGAKVSHLSYVGDAEIGEKTNIGCGFITCNYDGAQKHRTKIGAETFIGSDCQVIAPIEIGSKAFVAAGSTITKNIPDGGFGIARSQQVIKEGAAKKFLKSKN